MTQEKPPAPTKNEHVPKGVNTIEHVHISFLVPASAIRELALDLLLEHICAKSVVNTIEHVHIFVLVSASVISRLGPCS